MASVDLAKLYASEEYSDCTFVSAEGKKFEVHRIVFTEYPRLNELIIAAEKDRVVQLEESTEVVERLLQWMYGVEWAPENVQPTRVGIGKDLTDIMKLCAAAEKYQIPKLGDDAYGAIGEVVGQITTGEAGLHVLRDLTDDNTAGVLQRTLIDRLITLLPKEIPGAKRKRGADAAEDDFKEEDEEQYPEMISVPQRPGRDRKPTAKARLSAPLKPQKKSAPRLSEPAWPSFTKVHCVCQKPEDPYLVQCERCKDWFHPGCIGKGKYAESSYQHARKIARSGDEKMYREKDLSFTCKDCDEAA